MCLRVLRGSNKSTLDSYSVRKSVLTIYHKTVRVCRVDIFSDNLSRNSCNKIELKVTRLCHGRKWRQLASEKQNRNTKSLGVRPNSNIRR